jgi:RES domain-containing protein
LCKAVHSALDGEGARLWGGRWNSAGRSMVYAAASPSLAVLEVLVHLDLPAELLPDDLRLLTIEIPDDVKTQILDPSPTEDDDCRVAGDAFLEGGKALALLVRSVIVPQERNVLLNVRHPDMARVRVQDSAAFQFDPRLLS